MSDNDQQEQFKEAATEQYLRGFFNTLEARGYPNLVKDADKQEKALAAAQQIEEEQEKQAKRIRPVVDEVCEEALDAILS